MRSDESLGLYIHIPFCARRCDYCDFYVVVGGEPAGQRDFFMWLDRDMDAAAAAATAAAGTQAGEGKTRVDTIYIGGGTPSYVPAPEITALLGACRGRFDVSPEAEVTLEANPESVTSRLVAAWLAAGINRLSLGVQSFDDRVLAPRGRLYAATQAEAAARLARAGGFTNLGIDLIAGLPGETTDRFAAGIERAIALEPSHVSVYLIETDDALKETRLTREVRAGRERLADEDDTVLMYETAVRLLTRAGYRHYEISNFARPGLESAHNLKYWTGRDYLGLGPSAHSAYRGRRFGRPADMGAWIAWLRLGAGFTGTAGVPGNAEVPGTAGVPGTPGVSGFGDYTLVDPDARSREDLVLALRLMDGVDLAAFAARTGFDPATRLSGAIESLAQDDLATCESGRLRLTPRGILMANEVFARLA